MFWPARLSLACYGARVIPLPLNGLDMNVRKPYDSTAAIWLYAFMLGKEALD